MLLVRLLAVIAPLAGLLSWLPSAHAQLVLVGPEFQVNAYTTYGQVTPAVAVDAAGNFIVVWAGGSAGSDPGGSIQAQRFDSSGTPLGAQFQVNTYTTGGQAYPRIAFDAAGNFVVVWASVGSPGSDTFERSVQARRYESTGTPLGAQFQVNSTTTRDQWKPAVAMDPAGSFVVVWESYSSSGTDVSPFSVQSQRYDAAGSPVGGEFQVNTYTSGNQGSPSVAVDGAGNSVVVWQSDMGFTSWRVRAQRYDSAGTPLGGEFQVNTYPTGQYMPSVGADAAGNFVVVWYGFNETNYAGISGQRYDGDGTAVGAQFRIDTLGFGAIVPSVAVGATDFVVVWQSYPGSGTDTDGFSIEARRYDAAGTPQGDQFQVNTWTTDYQTAPALATDSAGNFVIVWQSQSGGGGTDPSDSIQGQRVAFLPTTTSSTSTSTSSTSSTSASSTSSSSSSSSTSATSSSSSSTSSTSSTSTSSTSSTTTSTLPTTGLLPGRTALVRDQVLAQFVARADVAFALPSVDVVAQGGSLRFFDTATTAGDDTYQLPAGSRWRGLGNPPGSKGYRYRGAGDAADPCKVVLIKERIIKGTCKGDGVTLRPPFTGDIGIVLSLGVGVTDRYCARFGGDEVRNDATLAKRRNAPAPGSCP